MKARRASDDAPEPRAEPDAAPAHVLDASPSAITAYRRFMLELDLRSNRALHAVIPPGLHGRELLTSQRVGKTLRNRARRRVESLRQGGAETPPRLARPPRADLEVLSSMQIELFETHVLGPGHFVDDLFALFAWGRLRNVRQDPRHPEWNCEPDSANYLLFAEFSIACIEEAVAPDFWSPMLRPQVWTQEIFFQVYRPPAALRAWNSYNTPRFPSWDGDVSAMRAHYARLSVPELIQEHAWNVFHVLSPEDAVHAHEFPDTDHPSPRRPR